MTGEFSSETSHTCARGTRGRRGREGEEAEGEWYKRQTEVRRVVRPYVCALIARAGGGSGGRRDVGGGRVVYRYSHGRVFAAIFGPFPFGARGAFTVHTSYRLTLAGHPLPLLLLLPAVLLARPPRPLFHPRVMDTQGVGDYANEASYGWRFTGGPKGNVIVQ